MTRSKPFQYDPKRRELSTRWRILGFIHEDKYAWCRDDIAETLRLHFSSQAPGQTVPAEIAQYVVDCIRSSKPKSKRGHPPASVSIKTYLNWWSAAQEAEQLQKEKKDKMCDEPYRGANREVARKYAIGEKTLERLRRRLLSDDK